MKINFDIEEEMSLRPCIYIAWSKTTGKPYIGQTKTGLKHRKHTHLSKVDSTRVSFKEKSFQTAIRELGWGDFVWEYLYIEWSDIEITTLSKILNKKERYFIKIFNSVDEGYNVVRGSTSLLTTHKYNNYKEKREALTARQRFKRSQMSNKEKEISRQGRRARQIERKIIQKNLHPDEYRKEKLRRREQKLRHREENWSLEQKVLFKEKCDKRRKAYKTLNRDRINAKRRERRHKKREQLPSIPRPTLSKDAKRIRRNNYMKRYRQENRDRINAKIREKRKLIRENIMQNSQGQEV